MVNKLNRQEFVSDEELAIEIKKIFDKYVQTTIFMESMQDLITKAIDEKNYDDLKLQCQLFLKKTKSMYIRSIEREAAHELLKCIKKYEDGPSL